MQKGQAYSSDEKRKAAYALNLCAVSISQIVDYNDVYILEQEYDAILNNLNLEAIPKDDALLKILVEILNTISFFRIQEAQKQKLEKDYQRRMKNAIWSAVPNLSVVAVGSPIAMALSVATQVGTAYMNYRREKANAGAERENAAFELQMTAMEQFHALRRELFTTAWRLADAYGFPDAWRLTENQIKQYDRILMDADEYRKYARLEAIAPNFEAYPPFWYFFAHTALYISENESNAAARAEYRSRARQHFEHYRQLNRFSLLREDQLAAAALLEYADLLLLEDAKANRETVYQLVQEAQKKAGIANDLLQLCAVAYLKIGKTTDAARLLKILVNEEYNTSMNAKILSRIYVSQYLTTESPAAYAEYGILARRVVPEFLFPMPKSTLSDQALEAEFVKNQKISLAKAYRKTLQAYAKKSRHAYEQALQDIFEPKDSEEARTRLVEKLKYGEYGEVCIAQLNQMVSGLDTLPAFQHLEKREAQIKQIEARLWMTKAKLRELQKKAASVFTPEDEAALAKAFSYQDLTENFFDSIQTSFMDTIFNSQVLGELNLLENDLLQFCREQELPEPEYLCSPAAALALPERGGHLYFDDVLLGNAADAEQKNRLAKQMEAAVRDAREKLVKDPARTSVYLKSEEKFDTYFENDALKGAAKYLVKQKAIAVVDDLTRQDYDLILTVNGIVVVEKNTIRPETIRYDAVRFASAGQQQYLVVWYPEKYENPAVDMQALHALIRKLDAQTKPM